jgi:hypothetical protein
MSKTSIKSTPDDPTPKRDDHISPSMIEAANQAVPEATEKELKRFRWSLLIWILGFGFIWAMLILELIKALIGMVRHAFGGG